MPRKPCLFERLRARLADRDLTLEVTDAAKVSLADGGYDPVYGARPLKRVIRTELENPLAKAMLAGTVEDGATVTVDVTGPADGQELKIGSG